MKSLREQNTVCSYKNRQIYDVIIVGGGPAGLTAAIYTNRAGLSTLLLERAGLGGLIAKAGQIENYPPFHDISGIELMQKFEAHVRHIGFEPVFEEVTSISRRNQAFTVLTAGGKKYYSRSIILATGTSWKKLNIPGESEFTGRGVSYCATCDGMFFKGRKVLVIGGGDTALTDALYLSKLCSKVFIAHRRDAFRAIKVLVERVKHSSRIELLLSTVLEEIKGDAVVRGVVLRNLKNNKVQELPVDAVFIAVGGVPNTAFAPVKKDKDGYIITDELMRTSVCGIFAAGDCRSKFLRQISTAVGDGAIAAMAAAQYLES